MDLENQYGTLAVQRKLLVLMKKFDALCQQEGIAYTVSSGTLLGTVRHKGFIPWDDDLDVWLSRKSYEQLLACLPTNGMSVERNTEQALWIDRLRLEDDANATMDLFILDNLPDNLLAAKLKVLMLKVLQGMMKRRPDYSGYSFVNKVLVFSTYNMGRLFSRNRKMSWYHGVSKWGNDKDTKYKILVNDRYSGLTIKYPKRIVASFVRLPFENIEVSALVGWDEYLTMIYGDYMTPPRQEERSPLHIKEDYV
ncbi:MAG: LicD family protein [Prevotella sp.]|nr:LicD family protein [Prevotella sp.]